MGFLGDPGFDDNPGGDPGGGGFDPFGAEIWAALNYVWELLGSWITYLYNLLWYTIAYLLSALQWLYKLAVNVLFWLKYNVVEPLLNAYKSLHDFLARIFGPVLDWINRIQNWWTKYILPWQKLAIEIISRVRIALQLLKLLGVKWAAKLDADLAEIQAWVTTSIQDIQRTLNTLSTLLGVVLDPSMLMRRDFFLGTLFSNLGAVKRAVSYGNNTPLTPQQTSQQSADGRLLNPAAPIATIDAAGNVTFDPDYQSIRDGLNKEAGDYTRPLPSQ